MPSPAAPAHRILNRAILFHGSPVPDDGVYAFEGGAGNIRAHATYVLFDPAAAVITAETDLTPLGTGAIA